MKNRFASLIVCSAFLATLPGYVTAAAAVTCEQLAALTLPQVTISTAPRRYRRAVSSHPMGKSSIICQASVGS